MFTGLKNGVVRKTGDIGEILVRNMGNFLNKKGEKFQNIWERSLKLPLELGEVRGFNFYENFQIDNVPVNHCENTTKIALERIILRIV